MILGTVELGMNYGINNKNGRPSRQQAFELLETAWNHGISELDTAAAYGDSERIIGEYREISGHNFLIDTKLPVSIDKNDYINGFEVSCKRLRVKAVNLLYLHSFEQCKDNAVLDFLQKQKEKGKIRHIGISVYEPGEMQYIVDHLPFVDTIQFPFNILDHCRWTKNGLLEKAHYAKKRLYVRSIFLQGLIFKEPSDTFVNSIGAAQYIADIWKISKKTEMTVAELAYQYVYQTERIDGIIIGCQNSKEVMANVEIMSSGKELTEGIREELEEVSKNIPEVITDPRKWKGI